MKTASRLTAGAIVAAAVLLGLASQGLSPAEAQDQRVYELRVYTTAEGRLGALLDRFGGGEIELFHKHGMKSVGYWTPAVAPLSENTMFYMLAHASREAAAASWQAFRDDPEWAAMRDASRADGPIVTNVESTFLDPTAFSPLQ